VTRRPFCVTVGRMRMCECGCGESIDHLRPNALYATNGCRSRVWRQKHPHRLVRVRKPSQQRKHGPRPGVTVYLPNLRVAQALLDGEDVSALDDARAAVRAAIERRERRA
jgi:hypothetical protein